jgi:hypothetical protein
VDAQEVAGVVVGRNDDLVAGADLQRPQGQLDCKGTAAAAKGKGHVVVRGQGLFEALDVGPVVAAPGAVQGGGLQGGADGLVRQRPARRSLGPNRRAAEQGRKEL